MHRILKSFLEEQENEALELFRESELVKIHPIDERPHQFYVVEYFCTGLIDTPQGIVEANRFRMGVHFPTTYWDRVDIPEVLTWLGPMNCFHPNQFRHLICPGHVVPGTPLSDLVLQCFEIVCYQKYTLHERDALNAKACEWARNHIERFPIDDRSILGRQIEFEIGDEVSLDEASVDETAVNQDSKTDENVAGATAREETETTEDKT
jgi:hypothetical protein